MSDPRSSLCAFLSWGGTWHFVTGAIGVLFIVAVSAFFLFGLADMLGAWDGDRT